MEYRTTIFVASICAAVTASLMHPVRIGYKSSGSPHSIALVRHLERPRRDEIAVSFPRKAPEEPSDLGVDGVEIENLYEHQPMRKYSRSQRGLAKLIFQLSKEIDLFENVPSFTAHNI